MRGNFLTIVVTGSIGIALAASPSAFARGPGGGPGFGAGGPGVGAHGPGFGPSGLPPGFSEGNKTGWNGGSTPPGWDKGKKKGWDCTLGTTGCVPPGLQHR